MVAGPGDARAAPAGRHGRMRAADADREQAIDALKAAFVQGRLLKDELDARVGQALAARTYAELAAVTADLPAVLVRALPLRNHARPPGGPSATKVAISCACTVIAAELFLLLTVFAFPVYGTLDIAVLANLVGLPLAGGLMLDTWRASRSRGQLPPRPGTPAYSERRTAAGLRRAGRRPDGRVIALAARIVAGIISRMSGNGVMALAVRPISPANSIQAPRPAATPSGRAITRARPVSVVTCHRVTAFSWRRSIPRARRTAKSRRRRRDDATANRPRTASPRTARMPASTSGVPSMRAQTRG
jgi:hypothetical protein